MSVAPLICPLCPNEVIPTGQRGRPRRYCSPACTRASRSNQNKDRQCAYCGEPAKQGGFCSSECHSAATLGGFESPVEIEARYRAARKVIQHERRNGGYDDTLTRYALSRTVDLCSEAA